MIIEKDCTQTEGGEVPIPFFVQMAQRTTPQSIHIPKEKTSALHQGTY